MKVINVIVSNDENVIVSVDSFGIVDEQLSDEVVDEAEELFTNKCIEIKFGDKKMQKGFENLIDDYRYDLETPLEEGYEFVGLMTVSLVWSSIDNVQL